MGTLTTFNADNGTDGASCTPANLPATGVTAGASSALTFSASAAMTSGALGYRANAVSGQNAYFSSAITPSKIQAFRGTLRVTSLPSTTRTFLAGLTGTPTTVCTLSVTSAGVLFVRDAAAATILTGPTITAGVDYDVSLVYTVGASTNDGQATLKVYNKASQTQVGATSSASAVNLGASACASVRVGVTDTGASNVEFYLDTLRFENDRTTEFPPHTALTYFDAENGVDGATVTASSMPGTLTVIGASSYLKYDASTPLWGKQGYHVSAVNGEMARVLVPLAAPSQLLAYRAGFRPLATASATRPIGYFGSVMQGTTIALYLRNNAGLLLFNSFGLNSASNLLLTLGQDYEIAVNAAVGASTNDGVVTGRIYDKATGALLDTWGSSAVNLRPASAGFTRADIGVTETSSTQVEYVLDSIRFANQADVLPGPTPASASMPLAYSLTLGANVAWGPNHPTAPRVSTGPGMVRVTSANATSRVGAGNRPWRVSTSGG